jgi:Cof subfamily protein (haloacid dehalogenase superfamily)
MYKKGLKFDNVVVDLDSTLFNSEKQINKNDFIAIKDFSESGGNVYLASGRSVQATKHVAEHLRLTTPTISFNGAHISRVEEQYSYFLTKKDVKSITEMAKFYQLELIFYSDKNMFIEQITPLNKRWLADTPTFCNSLKKDVNFIVKNQKNESLSNILKIVVLPNNLSNLNKMMKDLGELNSFNLNYTERYIEVTHPLADKSNALMYLSEHNQLDLNNTIAIGDNFNDLKMLNIVGLSIAVENAQEIINERSDIIVKDNNSCGVAEAINNYAFK